MRFRTNLAVLAAVSTAALFALSGCNPCEKLEEKLCADLGAEDCALWKKGGGPESLTGGRRDSRACTNMMAGPSYDAMLKGARAMADALR